VGVFRYSIGIAAGPDGPFERLDALVDTGSLYTWVPAATLGRLGLRPTGKRPFFTADSRVIERDIGRVWVSIDGQQEITLIVFGEETDQVLLGAYTLEGFALAADPVNKRLVPMPAIPAVTATSTS
jgi:predicted aspartyl protease